MAKEGVVVEGELRIESKQRIICGPDQRIDLGEAGIRIKEAPRELLQQPGHLLDQPVLEAQPTRDLPGFIHRKSIGRIKADLENLLGSAGSDLLDIHAALGRHHQHREPQLAIEYDPGVELAGNIAGRGDQDLLHLPAFGASLGCDQLHAENGIAVLPDLFEAGGELDPSALSSSAGVNLRLHHPQAPAKSLRSSYRRIHRIDSLSGRHGNASRGKYFFRLVFVNLQERARSIQTLQGADTDLYRSVDYRNTPPQDKPKRLSSKASEIPVRFKAQPREAVACFFWSRFLSRS